MFLLKSRLFFDCDYMVAWEQIFPEKSGTFYYPVQAEIMAGLYLEN